MFRVTQEMIKDRLETVFGPHVQGLSDEELDTAWFYFQAGFAEAMRAFADWQDLYDGEVQ